MTNNMIRVEYTGKKKSLILLLMIIIVLSGCNQQTINNQDNKVNGNLENQDLVVSKNEKVLDSSSVFKTEDYSDDYYVTWAVPDNIQVEDEWIVRLNKMLAEEGYQFGLKLIRIEDVIGSDSYEKKMYSSGADIAFVGWDWLNEGIVENGIEQGIFFCLDDYLEDSQLYDSKPKCFWDTVTFRGHIYLFPSENAQDGVKLIVDSGGSVFNGDVLSLSVQNQDYQQLYYGWSGLDFVQCFDLYYDRMRGVVVTKDGNIVNPFDDERVITFLYNLNKWHTSGKLVTDYENANKRDDCDIRLKRGYSDSDDSFYSWDMSLCKRYKCGTAILSSSEKKEKAFKLIELLRCNHDYGNLLVYGKCGDEIGSIDQAAYSTKLIFGLDDGLVQVDDGLIHFNSENDRKSFYEKNIKVSPTLYMDLPSGCFELYKIVDKYLGSGDSIISHDNYEEDLNRLIREYTEKFNAVFG